MAGLELFVAASRPSGRRWPPWSRRTCRLRTERRTELRGARIRPFGILCSSEDIAPKANRRSGSSILIRRMASRSPQAEGCPARAFRSAGDPSHAQRGLDPRHRLWRRRGGPFVPGRRRGTCAPCSPPAAPCSISSSTAERPRRSSSRTSSFTPCVGTSMHLDCLEVRLDVEIEAETILELEGARGIARRQGGRRARAHHPRDHDSCPAD